MPDKNEPHVRIFGEDFSDKRGRKTRGRGNFAAGIVILFIGAVLFLNNLGALSWEFWQYVAPFWPVLIIIAGLRVMVGHNMLGDLVVTLFILSLVVLIAAFALIKTGSPYAAYLPDWYVRMMETIKPLNNILFVWPE